MELHETIELRPRQLKYLLWKAREMPELSSTADIESLSISPHGNIELVVVDREQPYLFYYCAYTDEEMVDEQGRSVHGWSHWEGRDMEEGYRLDV